MFVWMFDLLTLDCLLSDLCPVGGLHACGSSDAFVLHGIVQLDAGRGPAALEQSSER